MMSRTCQCDEFPPPAAAAAAAAAVATDGVTTGQSVVSGQSV